MTKYKYKIKNLDCANCANTLERELQKITGLENVSINFMMEKLTLECKEEQKEALFHKMQTLIHKIEPEVQIEEEIKK
jgi:copper chaperone CopZ